MDSKSTQNKDSDAPPPYNPQYPLLPATEDSHVQQQPGYFPPPHPVETQPQQVVVRVVQRPTLGASPARIICEHCQADIETRVVHRSNFTTHIVACIMCMICCPFFWVPYCIDGLKDTVHECPNCNRFLGEYRR